MLDRKTCESERWLAVPGYEGRYEVSNQGRVRYLRQISKSYDVVLDEPRILAQTTTKAGYQNVGLWRDNIFWNVGVHRLVLMAFIGPPPIQHVGCHNDNNGSNNWLTNLRWDTQKGNMADKLRHGTAQRGENNGRTKLTASQVAEIRAASGSHRSLGLQFGVSHKHIGEIKRGMARVFD